MKNHSKTTTEQFLIFLFLLATKRIFIFISLQKCRRQSFKAHVIWGIFSYLKYFLPSHLCFSMRFMSNYGFLPSSKIPHLHPELGALMLPSADHQFDNEGVLVVIKPWQRISPCPEASGCCVNPSLQIALQGFGAQRWMDVSPFSSPCLQSVPGDIPSYLVINTGDLLAQFMTLCWFMCWLLGTNPRSGSRGSTVDCVSMAPVLEGKFGGQRAPDLASAAGSKD